MCAPQSSNLLLLTLVRILSTNNDPTDEAPDAFTLQAPALIDKYPPYTFPPTPKPALIAEPRQRLLVNDDATFRT
jgi:hypothetical protein